MKNQKKRASVMEEKKGFKIFCFLCEDALEYWTLTPLPLFDSTLIWQATTKNNCRFTSAK